jgi:hypothetical protein
MSIYRLSICFYRYLFTEAARPTPESVRPWASAGPAGAAEAIRAHNASGNSSFAMRSQCRGQGFDPLISTNFKKALAEFRLKPFLFNSTFNSTFRAGSIFCFYLNFLRLTADCSGAASDN